MKEDHFYSTFKVQKGSEEWKQFKKRFKETLSSKKVTKLLRIQNKRILAKYLQAKKELGENPREEFHWHGCRVAPEKIWGSNDGFLTNYAKSGMWGKAIYFAKNASYSLDYAYDHSDGVKGMFFARVLLGNCKDTGTNNDSSLIVPPEGYNSVQGRTGGSDVFMVYFSK